MERRAVVKRVTSGLMLWVVVVILAAGASILTIRQLAPLGERAIGIVVAGFVAIAVVCSLPSRFLPAVALGLYASGASGVVAVPLPVPLPVAIMLVWVLRRGAEALSPARSPGPRMPGPAGYGLRLGLLAGLAAWILVLGATSPSGGSSAGWNLSFITAVLLPLFVAHADEESRLLRSTWELFGGLLGAYAVVESIAGANIVYWALGVPSAQHWSVYRAEGSFGHPLLLGTFLAVAVALSVGTWVNQRGKRHLVYAALASAGLVATSSRGALLAAAAGIAVALASAIAMRTSGASKRAALIVGVLVVVGAMSLSATPLADRWLSGEAAASTLAREQGIAVALRAAEASGWLGVGGGNSRTATDLAGFELPLESSALQALVSLGAPGAVLLCGLLIHAGVRTIRSRDIAGLAGLAAFTVAVSGFNYLDDRRSAHLLLGLVLLFAFNSPRAAAAVDSSEGIPTTGARPERASKPARASSQ